jgi:hypothetical protein
MKSNPKAGWHLKVLRSEIQSEFYSLNLDWYDSLPLTLGSKNLAHGKAEWPKGMDIKIRHISFHFPLFTILKIQISISQNKGLNSHVNILFVN